MEKFKPLESKVRAERAAERVARLVEHKIVKREFKQRLPAERTLCVDLGVSRACLREGLSLLVARGRIERQQGKCTRILPAEIQSESEIWSGLNLDHPLLQRDLIEFRQMLECQIAEIAALRYTADDRGRLQDAGIRVDLAYQRSDRQEQVASDVALHRAIADATHNQLLSKLMSSLLQPLHEHVQLSIAGYAADGAIATALREQHASLLLAVLDRNPAAARLAASTHLAFVRTRLNQIR